MLCNGCHLEKYALIRTGTPTFQPENRLPNIWKFLGNLETITEILVGRLVKVTIENKIAITIYSHEDLSRVNETLSLIHRQLTRDLLLSFTDIP